MVLISRSVPVRRTRGKQKGKRAEEIGAMVSGRHTLTNPEPSAVLDTQDEEERYSNRTELNRQFMFSIRAFSYLRQVLRVYSPTGKQMGTRNGRVFTLVYHLRAMIFRIR